MNDDQEAAVEVHAAVPAESASPTSSPLSSETVPTTTTVDPVEVAKKAAAVKRLYSI